MANVDPVESEVENRVISAKTNLVNLAQTFQGALDQVAVYPLQVHASRGATYNQFANLESVSPASCGYHSNQEAKEAPSQPSEDPKP